MKHQYFGDVNDYRKYGLLRCLVEATGMNIGVCWMLTASDGRNDGNKVAYLKQPGVWRHHDPELFDFMHRQLLDRKRRSLDVVRKHQVIPGAMYFENMLTDEPAQRSRYFDDMNDALGLADCIFFDPDNGLQVKSVEYGMRNSCKYLYWNETGDVWGSGRSVIVYQHFPRVERAKYIRQRKAELATVCGGGTVLAFSTAHVLFLMASRNPIPKFPEMVAARWKNQIRFEGSGSSMNHS